MSAVALPHPARAGFVSKTLARVEANLLSTVKLARQVQSERWWMASAELIREAGQVTAERLADRPSYREWIEARLAALPEVGRLEELDAQIAPGLVPCDTDQARVLVALMVDAFPNARPHAPESYLETMVYEAGSAQFGAAAVAAATREIVTTATFLPTVAELLKVAADKQFTLTFAVGKVREARDLRLRLEPALAGDGQEVVR